MKDKMEHCLWLAYEAVVGINQLSVVASSPEALVIGRLANPYIPSLNFKFNMNLVLIGN